MILVVAAWSSVIFADPQNGPEPAPLIDPDSGEQLHGPPGTNEWNAKTRLCKDTRRCPTRTQLPWNWVEGQPCVYCDLNTMQKQCWGKPGDCTEITYNVLSAPPSCGVFWFGGIVDNGGNCVGAMASSTQVCYRLTCTNSAPVAP